MNTGRANMDPVAGGRVSAMFVPGGKDDGAKGKQAGCAQPPGQAGKAAPKPRGRWRRVEELFTTGPVWFGSI